MDLLKIIWKSLNGKWSGLVISKHRNNLFHDYLEFLFYLMILLKLLFRFFSTLTKSEVWDLYQRYKLDFELFGYSPDEYYGYASEDETTPSYDP